MPIRTSGNPDGISVLVHRKSSVVMWPILKMHYSLKSCRCYFCIKYFLIPWLLHHLLSRFSSPRTFRRNLPPRKSSSAMTKGITVATAKQWQQATLLSRRTWLSTANLSRKAISDMLNTCKVLIHITQKQSHHKLTNCKVEIHKHNTWIPTKCVYIHSPCAMNAVCSISQCHLALAYFWLLNYTL